MRGGPHRAPGWGRPGGCWSAAASRLKSPKSRWTTAAAPCEAPAEQVGEGGWRSNAPQRLWLRQHVERLNRKHRCSSSWAAAAQCRARLELIPQARRLIIPPILKRRLLHSMAGPAQHGRLSGAQFAVVKSLRRTCSSLRMLSQASSLTMATTRDRARSEARMRSIVSRSLWAVHRKHASAHRLFQGRSGSEAQSAGKAVQPGALISPHGGVTTAALRDGQSCSVHATGPTRMHAPAHVVASSKRSSAMASCI